MNISRWIKALKIGFAAQYLHVTARQRELAEEHHRVADLLAELITSYEAESRDGLCGLPPSTLHLLDLVPVGWLPETVGDLKARVLEARALLFAEKESPMTAHKAFAHHVLYGCGDESRLARLGSMLFRRKKPAHSVRSVEDHPLLALRLGNALSIIRKPFVVTNDRISAMVNLVSAFQQRHSLSDNPQKLRDRLLDEQLENILLHHAFIWPLLVFPKSSFQIGLSLPLKIDVVLPDNADQYVPLRKRALLTGLRAINVATPDDNGRNFYYHVRTARLAAWRLWRANHGNVGNDFKLMIKNATVIIDFSVAEEITAGILKNPELTDGSAAPYLAQAILGRFLGKASFLSSAVTGLIGDRRLMPERSWAMDYEFLPPGGIERKLRWLLPSHLFQRIVLPQDNETRIQVDKILTDPVVPKSAEVVFANFLSNVADAVHLEGWRRTNYVRCPELAWAVHAPGRPGLLPETNGMVQKVFNELAENENPIVDLDVPPGAVVSALYHLDRSRREQLDPAPPGLSWSFIRVVPYEHDERFWHVLWRILGGTTTDFESFVHSPTVQVAAAQLITSLNQFVPDQDRPGHRAPDLLALIIDDDFREGWHGTQNPCARPLAVLPLLDAIRNNGGLRISPARSDHEHLLQWLGQTRIILLKPSSPTPSMADRITPFRNILELLATFRWGFTQQMASVLLDELGKRGTQVREVLNDLCNADVVRYGSGEYFLPQHIRQAIASQSMSSSQAGKRHLAAAVAMAPYLLARETPGLGFDAAHIPEHVHEASFHLKQAWDLLTQANDQEALKNVRTCQLRMWRFAEYPSWPAVNALLNSRDNGACKDAYELSTYLNTQWISHPDDYARTPAHPAKLLEQAKALTRWIGNTDDRHRDETIQLFETALRNCSAFPDEQHFNELLVLNDYVPYLISRPPEERVRVDALVQRVMALRRYWGPHMGVFFETLADAVSSHAEATEWYALGADTAPGWKQNWFKGIGAAHLAKVTFPHEPSLLAMKDDETRKLISGSENGFYRQDNAGVDSWILDRWEAGRQSLSKLWHGRGCQTLLIDFGKNGQRAKYRRRSTYQQRRP